jgi:transcriptional regulator with XRE-family HTH domain
VTEAIRIVGQTEDTVTIHRSDFEALVHAAEDAEDLAALAAHDAEEVRLGRDGARRDYLTADEATRLLDGENPVRVWRAKRVLSQRALARAAGMQPGYLAEIETGRKRGSADVLNRLSTVLGVALSDLAQANSRMKQSGYGPVLLIETGRLAGTTGVNINPSPETEFGTVADALRAVRDQWATCQYQFPVIVDKATRAPIFRHDELKDLIVDRYNHVRENVGSLT